MKNVKVLLLTLTLVLVSINAFAGEVVDLKLTGKTEVGEENFIIHSNKGDFNLYAITGPSHIMDKLIKSKVGQCLRFEFKTVINFDNINNIKSISKCPKRKVKYIMSKNVNDYYYTGLGGAAAGMGCVDLPKALQIKLVNDELEFFEGISDGRFMFNRTECSTMGRIIKSQKENGIYSN